MDSGRGNLRTKLFKAIIFSRGDINRTWLQEIFCDFHYIVERATNFVLFFENFWPEFLVNFSPRILNLPHD